MKKFFVVILAASLCLAIAMPAMAKMTIKGGVDTRMCWENQDQDYMNNTTGKGKITTDTERDWWSLDTGKKSSIEFAYTNDDGNFGVVLGIGDLGSDGWNAAHQEVAFGWWQINPMFKVTIGRQKGFFGAYGAINHKGKVVGPAAAGDVNSDCVDAGIRLDAKASDNFTFSFMIADSHGYNTLTGKAAAWTVGGNTWNAVDNEQETPAIMAALNGSYGPISFAPSYFAGNYEYEWDQNAGAAATTQDELSYWAFAIPVKASIGPATLSGEYTWGENLGDIPKGNFIKGTWGKGVGAAQYSAAAPWQAYDTDYDGWFLRADIKGLGPGTLSASYGEEEYEGSAPAAVTYDENSQWAIQYSIPVLKGFNVIPFYQVYDWEDAGVNGISNLAATPGDQGQETVFGIEFWIFF